MKLQHLKEPRLAFADGIHVCPRHGIAKFGVFDKKQPARRNRIIVGGVGTSSCLEALSAWLVRCQTRIETPADAEHPNLHPAFCGFNAESGFAAELVFGNDVFRALKKSEIDSIVKIKIWRDRVTRAVELFYEDIKFLAENRQVDVIVCVIPENLYKRISIEEEPDEEMLDASVDVSGEMNFRRALKAKSMHLGKPLQLVRGRSLESGKRGQQDDATKAWNFCTALYYKSGPVIPWKLVSEESSVSSCALGIAFYRSRDNQTLNTSVAQIFDELGNGLILRGTEVDFDKDDRVPHLTTAQAHDLFVLALNQYRIALRNFPARVVVHKSSNYSEEEVEGLVEAARELRIDAIDLVTVLDSKLRLFREGNYPPYRGTTISISETRQLLYTRGSVPFYETYPGSYIPQPIELRIKRSECSPAFLAREILGLSKMNWNNTQFDGKYPVTLGCARKVGEILKYLDPNDKPQLRYSYYM